MENIPNLPKTLKKTQNRILSQRLFLSWLYRLHRFTRGATPMSEGGEPDPHSPSFFCRPLGFPIRSRGPRVGLVKKKKTSCGFFFRTIWNKCDWNIFKRKTKEVFGGSRGQNGNILVSILVLRNVGKCRNHKCPVFGKVNPSQTLQKSSPKTIKNRPKS